jgi:hypothetical protein
MKVRKHQKIEIDVRNVDGERMGKIVRVIRFQGVLYTCKYNRIIYHIHPSVRNGERMFPRPFIIVGMRENITSESINQRQYTGGEEVKYLIMDERYRFDEDSAICMDTADTLEEARGAARDQGGIVVEADSGEIIE